MGHQHRVKHRDAVHLLLPSRRAKALRRVVADFLRVRQHLGPVPEQRAMFVEKRFERRVRFLGKALRGCARDRAAFAAGTSQGTPARVNPLGCAQRGIEIRRRRGQSLSQGVLRGPLLSARPSPGPAHALIEISDRCVVSVGGRGHPAAPAAQRQREGERCSKNSGGQHTRQSRHLCG